MCVCLFSAIDEIKIGDSTNYWVVVVVCGALCATITSVMTCVSIVDSNNKLKRSHYATK